MKEPYLLDDIAHNIGQYCIKWGRISVTQTKEKYGTVRVYCGFGFYTLHSLIWPNYCYKHPKYPDWLWGLDIKYISPFITKTLGRLLTPWQVFIYKRAYWKYIRKYPHLFDEITDCADYKELLGFHIPYLCDIHSENYNKLCYLGNETNCEECKE